jgi:hypothetical protein
MPKNEFDKIKEKLSAEELRAKKNKSRQESLKKSRQMQKRLQKNTPTNSQDTASDTSSECSFSSTNTASSNNSRRSSKSSVSTESNDSTLSSQRFFHARRWNTDTHHYSKERTKRPAEHVHGISKEELNRNNLKGRS